MWTYWSAWCLSLTLSGFKLIRDTSERGHSREAVMDSVVRSMKTISTTSHRSFPHPLNFQRFPPSTLQTRSRQKDPVAR
ncbi:hypothetical protein ACVXHA_09945 [Escherichia coli]